MEEFAINSANKHYLAALVARLNEGDPAAFDALYQKCSGYIAFVCSKFCYSKEDAEDVVQDTFLIAYKKAGTLRSESLIPYLRKIAIHECYRKRSSYNFQQFYNIDIDETLGALEESDEDFLPEAYLHNQEQRTELLDIVMTLPKMQWETIYLFYYASFSTEEIARLQECTPSNVRKTLRTARATIKRQLEGTYKKKRATGVVLAALGTATLGTILIAEEQVFAAVYIPAAAPCWAGSTAAAAVATTAATTSIGGYIAAACASAVLIVSAATYYLLLPDEVPVMAESPPVVQTATAPPTTPQPTPEPTPIAPVFVPAPTTPTPTTPVPTTETPPTAAETQPPTAPPTDPPPPITTPPETTAPPPIDRTQHILTALANATGDVSHILDYYAFTFARYIRNANEILHFYTTNEGSGDILVGTATCEDGMFIRMHFAHFYNGTAPSDVIQLLSFLE
ncbi:MAG: sigma-70 family RNA polymerase sigma factor [Defluviitaleaceae bacterium]|nr:sigma-70 family RNA polymerase sigma factor [Defluviitaleaceae bacterium]